MLFDFKFENLNTNCKQIYFKLGKHKSSEDFVVSSGVVIENSVDLYRFAESNAIDYGVLDQGTCNSGNLYNTCACFLHTLVPAEGGQYCLQHCQEAGCFTPVFFQLWQVSVIDARHLLVAQPYRRKSWIR